MTTRLTPNQGDESVSTPGDSREPAEVGATRGGDRRGTTVRIAFRTHRDCNEADPTGVHRDRARWKGITPAGIAARCAAPLEL